MEFCWSILINAHKLLKEIIEHAYILTKHKNGKALANGDAIPSSNFKSIFKSMVSNQPNFNKVGIEKFLRALRSLGIKKDEISASPLKPSIVMWRAIAPTSVNRLKLSMKMRRKVMTSMSYAC